MENRQPRTEYEQRRGAALARAARLDGRGAVLGHARVPLVLAALAVGGWRWSQGAGQPWTLHAVLAGLYVVLLAAQLASDRRRDAERGRAAWYARCLARLDGRWRDFPSQGERHADARHPYARDLDVVGRGSLFQLMDTTRTAQGAATLARWLLAPATAQVLAERTQAVRLLAARLDAREALALAGGDADVAHVDDAPLVEWSGAAPVLEEARALRAAAVVLPPVTVATIALVWAGLAPGLPLLPLAAAHAWVIVGSRRRVAVVARAAEHAEAALARLLPLLETAATLPREGAALARLHDTMQGAVAAVRELRRRVTLFQSRANLFVAVLQPFVFWDLHAARLLERWKGAHGALLPAWTAALGELEALVALGTYAAEHPGDAWPEVTPGPLAFEAQELGHPLLAADRCVRNDVSLAGPGTVLLITGSNMSGKSTLLRAVGLSAVLALAGAPVRARRLRLSPLQVAAAMRVTDSLQEGMSLFAAELASLRRVTDLARGPLPLLFLLDEILQGTNTRERSLGARGIVAHLLRLGAAGLVSTHDLSLVRLGDALGDRVRYAHFEDQLSDGRMTFDYRMRPGVVSTSNALRLMQAYGLEVEVPAE